MTFARKLAILPGRPAPAAVAADGGDEAWQEF